MKTILILIVALLGAASVSAQGQEPNFGDLFLMMNQEAVASSGKDSDRGGIGGVRQGSGGGGDLELGINVDWPDPGKMLAIPSEIAWKSLPDQPASVYEVIITRASDEEEIYRAVVDGERIVLPLDVLQLSSSDAYIVKVLSAGEDLGSTSKPARFSLASPLLYQRAINTARTAPEYADASAVEKISMEAFALETAGLHHEAYKLYSTAMSSVQERLALEHLARLFRERAKISCLCL